MLKLANASEAHQAIEFFFNPLIAYRDVVIPETPLGCVLITCAYVFNLK